MFNLVAPGNVHAKSIYSLDWLLPRQIPKEEEVITVLTFDQSESGDQASLAGSEKTHTVMLETKLISWFVFTVTCDRMQEIVLLEPLNNQIIDKDKTTVMGKS